MDRWVERQRFFVIDQFFSGGKRLRQEFVQCFADPKTASPKRFVWDFWHVTGAYRHLRATPDSVFSESSLDSFSKHLKSWGLKHLGCSELSPMWLSAYTEGCFQRLHADMPHGPWAFVYSLTPDSFQGRGGRTMIAKESLIDLWSQFDALGSFHESDFFDYLKPQFNRLIVFDPRIPHAVEQVENSMDLLDARLVIHGWFLNPQPTISGALSPSAVSKTLEIYFEHCEPLFADHDEVAGLLSFDFTVAPSGRVGSVKVLSNTLLDRNSLGESVEGFVKALQKQLKTMTFKAAAKSTRVVLPMIFAP